MAFLGANGLKLEKITPDLNEESHKRDIRISIIKQKRIYVKCNVN